MMLPISRRQSHYVYGFLQSGLTCGIAAAIASAPLLSRGSFLLQWLQSWLLSWAVMLPVVLVAAPGIRRLTHLLTRDDQTSEAGPKARQRRHGTGDGSSG